MKKLYIFALLLLVSFSNAQNPAALDLTFNRADGKPILDSEIRKVLVQPDGKYIVLGSFTNYTLNNINEHPQKHLVRLNADMSIDPTFNIGTGFSGYITDIAMQSTGKLIVWASSSGTYNGSSYTGSIVRINNDGSRDPTFSAGGYSYSAGKLLVQADDKIFVYFGQYISRLTANGANDNSFNQIFLYNGASLRDMLMLPTGELVIATGELKKYTSAGYVVSTTLFQTGGANCYVKGLTLQPDGKFLVFGNFSVWGTAPANRIVRINANGTLDTSFTALEFTDSTPTTECETAFVNSVALQPDGKILVGGHFDTYGGVNKKNIVKLNSNGTIDNTFSGSVNTEVSAMARLSNGNFIFGLRPEINAYVQPQYGNLWVDTILKTDASGNLQNTNVNTQHQVEKVMVMPNNQIALAGRSSFPNHRGVKLVESNGNLVLNTNLYSGFSSQLASGYYKSVMSSALQSNGKIVAGGYFTSYNGTARSGLARLNADYSLDAAFNIGTGFTGEYGAGVEAIAVQTDGKVIVGGNFNSFNGTPATSGLVRLTATGGLDATFTGSATLPTQIVMQPDGKILIRDYDGIKRLNANGSIDGSFAGPIQCGTFALLSTGKIIVANYGDVTRINSDGSPDATFTLANFGGQVKTMHVQPDGKILVGGTINHYYPPTGNSFSVQRLARLTANGQFDYAFDTGAGFNGEVKSITMQADGKILVGGLFTRYDGAWTNGAVRLLGGDAHVLNGTVRYDNASNGCTTSDPTYSFLKLRVTSGATTSDFITNTSGSFSIPFPAGTFTVTPVFENPAYQSASPASVALNFPADGIVVTQDFCVAPTGVHPDLEVVVVPVTIARPGFNSTYRVTYKNKGNYITSGSVSLSFNDAIMDFVTASPPATMTPNNAAWTFSNLLPNEVRTVDIVFNLNSPTETPSVNGGDVVVFTANLSSAITDQTPADNTFTMNQTVVNSYDPNDKTCLEGAMVGTVVIGNFVHYLIRFENKGTYAAQNITVRDIIDTNKFEIGSLVPLHASHSFVTNISGNQVDFFFENINLPFTDSSNDGYVAFKIKTKSTLVAGNSFSNSASIFFDYNAAIVTNTATTTISALAVEDFVAEKYFTVYPNPASALLNIAKMRGITVSSYSIYNMMGQLIMVITNANDISTIDVSGLQTGNYFIKVLTDKGSSNMRFVKN